MKHLSQREHSFEMVNRTILLRSSCFQIQYIMQQEKSNPDSLPSADTTLPRNCLPASTTCTVQISFAPKEHNIAEKKYIDHVPFY